MDYDYADDYVNDISEVHNLNKPNCKIVPAKDVEPGDIVFTNNGSGKGIQCCMLVSKVIVGKEHLMITVLDGLMLCDLEGTERYKPDQIGLRHDTKVGVVRGESHRF